MADDLRTLWDFDDPAASEQRFRDLATTAPEPTGSRAWTQVARALGLQKRYDEGHAVLDGLDTDGRTAGDPETSARVVLERGRLLRSAGDEWAALPCFEDAAAIAAAGHHRAALAAFEEALAARERVGDPARTRVARWMVAWSLRHLGEVDQARAIQLSLRAELESIGEHDPYVDEELGLLGHHPGS